MTKNEIQSILEKIGLSGEFFGVREDADGQLIAAGITVYYATAIVEPEEQRQDAESRAHVAAREARENGEELAEDEEELAESQFWLSLEYCRGGFPGDPEHWEWREEAVIEDRRGNIESITRNRGDDPHHPSLLEALANAIADADGERMRPDDTYEFTRIAAPDALARLHAIEG